LRKVPVDVTVIDRSNHHLFQPLLYQVATAGLSPADIASPIRSILRDCRTEVRLAEVTGIDRVRREVLTLGGGRIPYDFLVIATGARHSYFGQDDWARFAPGLKSIADATHIRQKLLLSFEAAETESDPERRRALLNFVIIGGGPTGVELAGSIAELAHTVVAKDFRHINPRSARVLLLEAGPRLLAAFPEKLGAKAGEFLRELGVEVRTGARVAQVGEDGVTVAGERIPARTLIWAAGVKASPAGQWLGAETDRNGRVIVNRDLTLPGDSDVFVIGDTAHAVDENGAMLPGVAPVAMQQGRYVARVIASRVRLAQARARGHAAPPLAPAPFHYVDKGSMATVGRSRAVATTHQVNLAGFVAWLAWLFVHLLYLIGFRNRVAVVLQWAWSYVTFRRGARLITQEDAARAVVGAAAGMAPEPGADPGPPELRAAR
jgi:NADH dehydrogenase